MKTTIAAAIILVAIAGIGYWQSAKTPDSRTKPADNKAPKTTEVPKAIAPKAPEPPPAPTHKASLEVRARTWRQEPPFDIAKDLTEKLLQAGIAVVPKAEKVEAMLLAEYNEEKGETYRGTYGLGAEAGFGTAINLKLTALSAAGETLLTLTISAHTPYSVDGNKTLYQATLDDLQKDTTYSHVQDFVGAALGIKTSLSKLVPAVVWLESREQALAVLKRQNYRPANEKEAAMFAIARQDYAQCVKIGKPAVDPLLMFLDKYGYADHVQNAARTLGEIGDPRAAEGLLKKLRYYAMILHSAESSPAFSTSQDDRKAAVAVIEALGKVGDGFALADLEPLAASKDAAVAAAAKGAVGKIRERVKGK